MADLNPFAGLAPVTPEGLGASRAAQFEEQAKGQSFWAQEAGRTGLKMRQRMLEQGVALSPEDERALTTQSIMQGAQKRLADLVKSGTVDPMDAQETVIREAMSGFMAAGDYSGAQSLLPSLNQIRTYKDEQAKLQSETVENLATADKDAALGVQARTRAGNIAARTPAQIAADEALANQRNADARLKDRTDPNLRAQPRGGEAGPNFKEGQAAIDEKLAAQAGTLTLFGYLNDLSNIMETAPRAASAVSGAVNTGGQYLAGAKNFLDQKGTTAPVDLESLSSEQKAIVARNVSKNRVNMARQAATLGMDVTRYNSLVIETAYALARVNDPGGRLSNNDFDFAMQQLGAVQDAKSAKAAFYAIAKRARDKIKDKMRVLPADYAEQMYGTGNEAIEAGWAEFESKWGDKSASPGPGKDGWTEVSPGVRIRPKSQK